MKYYLGSAAPYGYIARDGDYGHILEKDFFKSRVREVPGYYEWYESPLLSIALNSLEELDYIYKQFGKFIIDHEIAAVDKENRWTTLKDRPVILIYDTWIE